MEKKSSRKVKLLLAGIVLFVVMVNVAFAIVMKPLVQKSSNIEDYTRPGIDTTADSGTGVKPLVVVTTAAELSPPILAVDAKYEKGNSAFDWIAKPLSNSAFDWITKPVNQIILYLFGPERDIPAVESELGNLVISDNIANPFE